MALLQNAIPIRWPGGPLDIARRGKAEGFTAEARQAIERFHDPASLDILKDSPLDCLVLTWAGGAPEDAAQQKSALPLVQAARQRKLAVVGWVDGGDHNAAIAAAKTAGLDALVVRDFKGKTDFPVIPFSGRANVPWDAPAPLLALGDNVWPGVSMPSGADAGPTSAPWLDSNSWYIQLARARARMPLWLAFDPPAKGRVVSAQAYPTAIADTEAAGARWVISLDPALLAGLAAGNAASREALKQVGIASAFFQKHAVWKSYHSLGVAGVLSDFTGADFDMSGEILNLMSRRNLQFRPIWKSRALAQPFTGLKALVYADAAAPAADLRRKMMTFVEQGGLLVTGPKWGSEGKPVDPGFATGFAVHAVGKGRLAVAKAELSDAWQVAGDTQLLISHANDLVKIYNSSSSGCTLVTGSPDGKAAVVHALSYAGGGRSSAALRTVWVNRKYRSARFWTIGSEGAPIQGSPSEEYFGMEYEIPAATTGYFALEFEV